MKIICYTFAIFLLAVGMYAIITHEYAFGMGCCAMSCTCRIDAELEELKERSKK